MPAADRHFPEDRDEMLQEIRSVPKQVIKKSEAPRWLTLLSPESPMAGRPGDQHVADRRGASHTGRPGRRGRTHTSTLGKESQAGLAWGEAGFC